MFISEHQSGKPGDECKQQKHNVHIVYIHILQICSGDNTRLFVPSMTRKPWIKKSQSAIGDYIATLLSPLSKH